MYNLVCRICGYSANALHQHEVDEKQHFKNSNLCQKDIQRQKEIEDFWVANL